MEDNIELQNQYLELQTKYNELEKNYNNITAENQKLTSEKLELQKHNQELFIRCTSPVSQITEKSEYKTKTIEEIAKEMRGKK